MIKIGPLPDWTWAGTIKLFWAIITTVALTMSVISNLVLLFPSWAGIYSSGSHNVLHLCPNVRLGWLWKWHLWSSKGWFTCAILKCVFKLRFQGIVSLSWPKNRCTNCINGSTKNVYSSGPLVLTEWVDRSSSISIGFGHYNWCSDFCQNELIFVHSNWSRCTNCNDRIKLKCVMTIDSFCENQWAWTIKLFWL